MLNSWSLYDLVSHLRRERLFVTSEQTNLQSLNEKVKYTSTHLAQLAWISSHQRINLNHLILAKIDCLPALNCQRNYTLEKITFTEASKVLGYQDSLRYGEFLSSFRDSWELVGTCLALGDKYIPEAVPDILHSLYAGLYGSCLLAEDKLVVLKLLRHLTVLQLVPSDNPRRLLRHGTCAFARFYSVFHENLYSAKLFLTAALHGPIMKLLMEDEMFLDIDPDKADVRYPPEERLRKFGADGTPEHVVKLQRYRDWTIKRLFYLSEYFIYSIRDNMHCFPTSVCWLVRQMAGSFAKSGCLGEKEIFEICLDLVFTYFICPAIVNPEPYGITDAPIGYVARFNLMQVAQILQMLAMRKYEDVDPKVADLYSQFRSDSVSSLLDGILGDRTDYVEESLATDDIPEIDGITRFGAFFTCSQLNSLVTFLQNLLSVDDESINKNQLESLLARLPPLLTNGHNKSVGSNHLSDNSTNAESSISHKPVGILRKVGKQRNISSGLAVNGGNSGFVDGVDEVRSGEEETPERVLIFSLSEGDAETIGLMPEQKVLELEEKRRVNPIPIDVTVGRDLTKGLTVDRHRVDTQEKRTRFSLSHDEGSIGNTSDNLEAVSEAASNHSGASSLESENEDQNDNLSDMVSANVSGRGTPNISGRDTPSSQVTEGDEGRVGEGEEIRTNANDHHRQAVPTVSKQSRSDIDDKFGKFEIKKQEMSGDETISLVSDTWSTDVLASDSETVEQSERLFPRPPDDGLPHPFIRHSLDISETASEAWSTDVLASDSERLTEVDTDDTASVARSDDTAHSESGIRIETEGGETPPPAPHLGALFRPIREAPVSVGRICLAVPPSPTKADTWTTSIKTGGRPDCRRRTLEYLDSGTFKGFNKSGADSVERNRLIHVIDKIDSKSCCTSSGYVKGVKNGTISSFKSPSQPQSQSQIQFLPNGIVNPLSDSVDQPQKLLGENSGLPSTDSDRDAVPPAPSSEKVGETNEETRGLFDDGDTTPPSPLLSNPVISRSSLSSSAATFVGSHKVQTYALSSNKYNDIKSKQEIEDSERVFLSSTSLASTSSSGSNSGAALQPQPAVRNVDRIQVSTGAIPKSISFDKTAERGDKELADEDQKQKKGFFRNLKMSFKSRRGKHLKGDDTGRFHDQAFLGENTDGYGIPGLQRESSDYGGHRNGDAIEDILAKYRGKPITDPEEIIISRDAIEKKSCELDDDEGLSDESIFLNAKRKLRLVFSSSDVQSFDAASIGKTEDELVSFLNLQLAEAINLQNRSLVSQIHEALRCVKLFDDEGCRRLFKSLKEDYQNRAPYIAYLVRSRQKLLLALSHFQRMKERLESDARVCRKFLVALCARIFLERREESCRCFTLDFQQLTLADEKTDLLDKFLKELFNQLEKDYNWQGASETQLQEASSIIETSIMSRVYPYALYPNGDGDISRDQVLHEHMKKLSTVITPNHKDLRIPKRFHVECPWPSAQAEISSLPAYKTPKDKARCVRRCATTIMNLLAMATEGNVPAADDFIPVLVYVLIAANPPSLLSTVQYVESFYGDRLEGEEHYWWTQFSSAIEFIKTMDYGD